MESGTYKSPTRKLVRFFESSRNKWKRKCLDAKAVIKKLKTHVRAVEKSRDHWKQLAREQRERADRLEREVADKRSRGSTRDRPYQLT